MSDTLIQLKTYGIGALGVVCFWLLGLPLPFLMGPLVICLIVALAGVQLKMHKFLNYGFRTILGVAIGAAITPEVLNSIPQMGISLAIVPVFMVLVALTSFPLLKKVFKLDNVTAYYGAMPGGLQDLLIFGEAAGGNVRALSLIHATRVLLIIGIAPIIIAAFWDVDLLARPGAAATETPPLQIGLMIFAGLGGWWLAEKLKLLGATIIGPLVLTTILSLTGVITQRPPAEMIWASQFFIAIGVGAKYVGLTWQEFKRYVFAGIVNGVQLAVVSALFIQAIVSLGIAPGLDAFLAFLPGGQSEMVVMAIIAGADLTYVVLHHILRIVMIVSLAPILFRLFKR
ncbi:MAG: AbrB family transcriptional regulator [Cognatishimia sp.]|uniref:AbrB family transcriptional regulator n=1 Tax=Cognatishimia sp. TaxID=2211648 RepID=UPI003B8B1E2E